MAPNDTWDDGGFDDKDGFMDDAGASSAAPVPAPDEAVPPTPEPAPKRIVITEPTPIPPPPVEEKKRGAGYWTLVVAGLLLFVALGGYGLYWLFGRPTVEDELFIADEGEPSAIVHDTPSAAVPPATAIDTPLVTRNERMTDSAVPAPVSHPEQQPKHSKPEPTPRKAPETSLPTTPAPSKNQPLFVVQVFSSPSRDDADEWLQMLKEKSIADGYITEQQIKGKSWFRVRFGQYGNREDAEAAAIRFGFRQPWIARIR